MKAGWKLKPLGEVCAFQRGLTYSKNDEVDSGGTSVLRATNVDLETGQLDLSEIRFIRSEVSVPPSKMVEPGTLLICTASGSKKHLGKTALIDRPMDFAFGGFMGLLKPHEGLLPKYLQWLMRSDNYWSFIDGLSDGANINNLKFKQLAEFPVPLPPLEEQKRIVAILDEAFEGLDRARAYAEANLQNARELFDRAVFELFEGLRTEHPILVLSEMAEKITKGSSPKWQGISYVDEPGILFVTSENVGKNEINLTKRKYVEDAFNEKDRKSILAKGDVLTNIVGASIGRTAVFELDDAANINQAVCLIRCESKRLNNYFLSYLLNSPYFKAQLHAGEVNMARANLSLTFFRELKVPVPPVDIQEEVVQKVDALRLKTETLEKDYQSKLQDLDDLRQSLLRKALAGELT